MFYKRYIFILISVFCLIFSETIEADSINILCSFHPLYIFTQNVTMNVKGVSVDYLLPNNVGPHDYSLTPGDMKKIAKSDVFIVNGLQLEEFLDKAIKEGNPKIKVIDTSIGVKLIKTESEEEHGEEEHDEGEHEHHHGVYNPHIWVSPKSAIIQVRNIEKALSGIDKNNAKLYKANADKYVAKLQTISNELANASKKFKNRNIITFHNAFDYFARDFNLKVVGVIEVVPGHEPSAGELSKMIKKIKESEVIAIFSEPQYPVKVADILSKETNIPIYQLDPVATGDGKPDTYEKIMRKNIEVLKKALGSAKQ